MAEELRNIVNPLITWYRENKRTLPWRDKGNAYYTWVSEIMLQQTRVEAVKPYFLRFVARLPDVQALAACPEEELMRLWEGLGYYSRARNLQAAARQVVLDYDGTIPPDYDALLNLKGIGEYTAGAIASIAFGIRVPAVDGNVLRVVARLTQEPGSISSQAVRRAVRMKLMDIMKSRDFPRDCAGDFNQAMMELGAVVCVPNGQARCGECPLSALCLARKNGTVEAFPVKNAKRGRRVEERTILLIKDKARSLLVQRPPTGLLAGMYEPINYSGTMSVSEINGVIGRLGYKPVTIETICSSRHVFSHVEWHMSAYLAKVEDLGSLMHKDMVAVTGQEAEKLPIPSAFRAYVDYLRT